MNDQHLFPLDVPLPAPQPTVSEEVSLTTLGVFGNGGLLVDKNRPQDWWESAADAAADELPECATMVTLPQEEWNNEAGELLMEAAGELAALLGLFDEHGTRAFDSVDASTRAQWAEANGKLAGVRAALDQRLSPSGDQAQDLAAGAAAG